MQQNDMMSQCMNEVPHMRENVANLSERVTGMETSEQALGQRSTVASTPESLGQREEPRRHCVEQAARIKFL